MTRKQILYHITPAENVPTIKQQGLKHNVLCCENPETCWWPGSAIFIVRITGLPKENIISPSDTDEILILQDVPLERLHLCAAYEVIRKKTIRERYNRMREEAKKAGRKWEPPLGDLQ